MMLQHPKQHPSLWQQWLLSFSVALVLVVAAGVWGYQQVTQLAQHLINLRAASVAQTTVLALESISDQFALQRFVSALAAERDIQLVMVVAGEQQEIIASSTLAWLHRRAADLSDAHLRGEIARNWSKVIPDNHHYQNELVDLLLPIQLPASAQGQLTLEKGMVVVVINSHDILSRVMQSMWTILAVFLLVLTFLFSFWASVWWRFVLRPIDALRRVMKQRTQGVSLLADEASSKEMHELVSTYNAMVQQEQLASAEIMLLQSAFQNSQDGIVLIDQALDVVMVNRAACHLFGVSVDAELLQKAAQSVLRGTLAEDTQFWQHLVQEGSWTGSWLLTTMNHSERIPVQVAVILVRDAQHQVTHYLFLLTDFSQQQAAEEHIHYLSEFDVLTGLPNQKQLMQAVNTRMATGLHSFAVVLLDLDRFKHINEALGHEVGNQLLQAVATRLASLVDDHELLARMSGDEFALLLALDDQSNFSQRLAQMLTQLAEPYAMHDHQLTASVSMGVSCYPNDAQEASLLLSRADAALYQAKASGRNTFVLYKPDEGKNQLYLLRLESDLRNAIGHHQLQVYYQPQIDIKTNKIVGVEALVRWLHPKLGMISPAEFIPLAEETGLILPIGHWVLEESCAQAKRWYQQGMPIRIAVNVSVLQFVKADYVQLVRNALEAYQLPPHLLELELTESIMALSKDQLRTTFAALKSMGVYLAMDDFGTGFSSLSYLDAFPLDRLKIDQSFIRSMDSSEEGASLGVVKAVIELANAFGLSAIAEGVETENQLKQLKSLGCEEFQGYFCSRPLPADAFTAFYQQHDGHCHEACFIQPERTP